MPRRDHADFLRGNVAPRGLDASHLAAFTLDARDLAILDDIDTEGIRRPCIAPGDAVMTGNAAAPLQGCAKNRMPCFFRDIDDRAEFPHPVRIQPFRIDAVQAVRIDPAHPFADIAKTVGKVHDTTLAQHDVVVDLLR